MIKCPSKLFWTGSDSALRDSYCCADMKQEYVYQSRQSTRGKSNTKLFTSRGYRHEQEEHVSRRSHCFQSSPSCNKRAMQYSLWFVSTIFDWGNSRSIWVMRMKHNMCPWIMLKSVCEINDYYAYSLFTLLPLQNYYCLFCCPENRCFHCCSMYLSVFCVYLHPWHCCSWERPRMTFRSRLPDKGRRDSVRRGCVFPEGQRDEGEVWGTGRCIEAEARWDITA